MMDNTVIAGLDPANRLGELGSLVVLGNRRAAIRRKIGESIFPDLSSRFDA